MTPKTKNLILKSLRNDDYKAIEHLIKSNQISPFDPLLDAPLFIKCIEAEAIQIIKQILELYKEKAFDLWHLDNGINQPGAFLAAKFNDVTIAESISKNAKDILLTNFDGTTLFETAIKSAKWAAAEVYFNNEPKVLDHIDFFKRSMLQCMCEPGVDYFGINGYKNWTKPPNQFLLNVINYNPDFLIKKNKSNNSVLLSAIFSKDESFAFSIFNQMKMHLTQNQITESLIGNYELSVLASCILNKMPKLAEELITFSDLNFTSLRGVDLASMAIFNAEFDLAEKIIKNPKHKQTPKNNLSVNALRSIKPLDGFAFLKRNNLPTYSREISDGVSTVELAWQNLPFNEVIPFWESLKDHQKRLGVDTLLGIFESAATSSIDMEAKVQYLLKNKIFPVKLNKSVLKNNHKTRFYRANHRNNCELNPFWVWVDHLNNPITDNREIDKQALDFSISNQSSLKNNNTYNTNNNVNGFIRPSILPYLVSKNLISNFKTILKLDSDPSMFSVFDWQAAWMEALNKNVPIEFLSIIKDKMISLNENPFNEHFSFFAISKLGPKKYADIGFPVIEYDKLIENSSTALESFGVYYSKNRIIYSQREKISPNINTTIDDLTIDDLFDSNNTTQSLKSADVASNFSSTRALQLLKSNLKYPAATLKIIIEKLADYSTTITVKNKNDIIRTEIISFLFKNVSTLAQRADLKSPWGQDPKNALTLFNAQLEYEFLKFKQENKIEYNNATFEFKGIDSIILKLLKNDRLIKVILDNIDNFPPIKDTKSFISNFSRKIHNQRDEFSKKHEDYFYNLNRLYFHLSENQKYQHIFNSENLTEMASKISNPAIVDDIINKANNLNISMAKKGFSELVDQFLFQLSPSTLEKIIQYQIDKSIPNEEIFKRIYTVGYPINSNSFDNSKLATTKALRTLKSLPDSVIKEIFLNSKSPILLALQSGNYSIAIESLKFLKNKNFDTSALDSKLIQKWAEGINIYYHNITKLSNNNKSNFDEIFLRQSKNINDLFLLGATINENNSLFIIETLYNSTAHYKSNSLAEGITLKLIDQLIDTHKFNLAKLTSSEENLPRELFSISKTIKSKINYPAILLFLYSVDINNVDLAISLYKKWESMGGSVFIESESESKTEKQKNHIFEFLNDPIKSHIEKIILTNEIKEMALHKNKNRL